MALIEFHLPDIGEGLAEVELIKWLVAEGDTVEENQPVADVESDKAIVTMPAPASGRVVRFAVAEGQRIKVGELMMVIEGTTSARSSGDSGGHAAAQAASSPPAPVQAAVQASAPVAASPAVRKLAQELGVALDRVQGTGPRGRITTDDVQRAAQAAAASPAPPAAATPAAAPVHDPAQGGAVEHVPFRGVRRRIAEAMEQSARTIPHVCGFHEFDGDGLVRVRASLAPLAEKHGVRLTYLAFIVKAVTRALEAWPIINASLDEANERIVLKKFYNIGIATSAPDGLVVPVIQGADRRGLLDLAREIERLSTAARERKLTPGDGQHGTFTISNVGAQRGWLNTSLIRHPEVAILGVGKIEERAVVRGGQVMARPVLPLAFTFDHRVVDGEQGLGFMLTLRELLERPEALLVGEPLW